MRAQAEVSATLNRRLVGSVQEVLVCGENDLGRCYGRLASQAPEIDGVVYLHEHAPVGRIASARISGTGNYDLEAELLPDDTIKYRSQIGVDTASEYL